MIIPREAGLVRFYVQLDQEPATAATLKDLQKIVRKVLTPYELKWEHVDWHSYYQVKQGVIEKYSSHDYRVFLGGDACHIHSVSLLDPVCHCFKVFINAP